ncbi:MAG: single-stranded-DNA-specific exonuclease RecJ [Anaerolineae bacterium]
MKRKQWRIADPAPDNFIAAFPDLPRPVAQTLYNRGYRDPVAARAFLNGAEPDQNPFNLRGMQEAVRRLRDAIRKGEPIVVYGDYDVDGVTATALLVHMLHSLGATVRPYIPDRFEEGYGVNALALEKLAESGARVVVTVDCGIRSHAETALGRKLGLDIIVTDHHEPAEPMPGAAVAIICPRQPRCNYPTKSLAGVGLAYKLAQALYLVDQSTPTGKRRGAVTPDDLLDLVVLGTVADMAPLVLENRSLVRRGMHALNTTKRPGLKALFRAARIELGRITVDQLSYLVAPRLNAAGRLEHAMTSYSLLMTPQPDRADALAAKLEDQNRRRQTLTDEALAAARPFALGQLADSRLIFVADGSYKSGVVGLVANRLMEEFYRPAVVVEMGQEESRGSGRSIPEVNIVEVLDKCKDLLVRHGGHRAAAGFTVRNDRLPQLEMRLRELVDAMLPSVPTPTLGIDAVLPLADVTEPVWTAFERLAPFGQQNSSPLLATLGATVCDARLVGMNHLKLIVADQSGNTREAIAFRRGDWLPDLPPVIDIAYQLELNRWNGTVQAQMNVKDIRPTGDTDSLLLDA